MDDPAVPWWDSGRVVGMDRMLALARADGDVLTAARAARVGVDEHGLVRACRDGVLVRVRRDAYVVGEAWRAAGPTTRLVLRTRAVLLGRTDGAAACHEAGLAMHGLPLLAPVPQMVDLSASVSRSRSQGSVRVHPAGPEEPVCCDGFRTVPAAVAVAGVALRSGLSPGVVALDAALARGRCTRAEVEAALAVRALRPGLRRRADELLERADPRAESPGESLTRVLLQDLGHHVESQVEMWDRTGRFVARVDFLVDRRVVVEFDGAVKYSGADGREALVAEKRREDALRALGYVVVRLVWSDLRDPARVRRLLREALSVARAG